MDKIIIENLQIFAYHGVHDFEKNEGQNFFINTTLYTDLYKAGQSDRLEDTVSYSDVCRYIHEKFRLKSHDLIEKAAQNLAEGILKEFEAVRKVEIEVRKPEAPIGLPFESVSVYITREWHRAFLAVGSNMGDSRGYINKAVELLEKDDNIRVIRQSQLIVTKPYGGVEQDDFLNGAMEIETIYPPLALLDCLHNIEAACDRVRLVHWGPRTLDLDILLYDDLILDSDVLTIPHADMANRDFVLGPMREIAPHLIHPVYRQSMSELYDHLTASDAAVNSET